MPAWKIIGASVRGTSHEKNGTPCQDSHGYKQLEDGSLLIAVADGAGSASRSQEGARAAVEVALAFLEGALGHFHPTTEEAWVDILREVFFEARHTLLDLAQIQKTRPREYATTLAIAIATPFWLVTGQIGDGVTVAQTLSGDLFTLAPPQKGEYANETNFLTMDNALSALDGRIYRLSENLEHVVALAVLSDGLLRLALDLENNHPYAPFFQPLLQFVEKMDQESESQEKLTHFLNSERVNARTDDDKTLVLAARSRLP